MEECEALRIYALVHENRISLGNDTAGAAIYPASNYNEFLRQVEICQVADISTVRFEKGGDQGDTANLT